MDRGAWQASVHGVSELDVTEHTAHLLWNLSISSKFPDFVDIKLFKRLFYILKCHF